jgi:hypothetical protein
MTGNVADSRRYAGLWLAISVIWLYVGFKRMARHERLGWFLCGFYALIGSYYVYRLFRPSARNDTDNKPGSQNG